MKVYVVYEEDRGCGSSIVGVFSTEELANAAMYGSHMYCSEEELITEFPVVEVE